jgi:hypothetical protein
MTVSELIALLGTMKQDAIVVVPSELAYVEDLKLDGVLETHVCELLGQRPARWFDPKHGALTYTQCDEGEGGAPAVVIG